MALKPVLILTAAFGEGHNAAARSLAAAFEEAGVRASVRDVFAEAYGPANELVRRLYLLVINHVPAVWNLVFRILDKTSVVGGGIGVFGRAARLLARLIAEGRPDVIVSTYPGYGHLMDLIRRRGEAGGARLVTVVTDSLTVNSVWYRCGSDVFLVPNTATADVLLGAGVPADKVHATGFPVPLIFSEPPIRRAAPPFEVLFMVNSLHHLAPAVAAELLGVPEIRLTVTVGRDEELGRSIARLAEQAGAEVEIHGWTPRIPELIRRSHLLVSKAGGATVQEALAARTPMVITQIVPGQEEGNARLLIGSGAGELATTPASIAEAVRTAIADGGRILASRCEAAAQLGHPDASREAVRLLSRLVQ